MSIKLISITVILTVVFMFAHRRNVSLSRNIFATKMRLSNAQGIRAQGIDYENFVVNVLDVSRTELEDKKLFKFLSTSAIGRVNTLEVSSEQAIDFDLLRSRVEIGKVIVIVGE